MRLLDRLLDRAVSALPRHLHDRVVVFGSAPMVLAGLKPDVKSDLDLFVSEETFAELVAAGFFEDDQKPGVPRIALAEGVEVFKTWIGLAFPQVYAASIPLNDSRGLRVAALQHVLDFKLASNREKDLPDIEVLRQELGKRIVATTDMSFYEQNAHREINLFKNPARSWFGDIWEKANKPIERVADIALDNVVGAAVAKAVQGLVSVLNDGASWSVRSDAIYKEFRSDGHSGVYSGVDIRRLDLQDVDRTVGYLAAKYKLAALAEGASAGTLGAPGIAVDIPALVGLALRSVNEYATYYGFDVSLQHEQAYAMTILSAASEPTAAVKQVTMAELTKLSVLIAQRKTWAELERLVSVQVIKKIAQALGIRLTKAKLAQAIPLVGAAFGGGFNAWYIAAVTETAYHLYRERFLIEKYGPGSAISGSA